MKAFASRKNVDVKYVVDVVEDIRNSRAAEVERMTGRKPEAIKDFRQALDDKAVDAIMLGTPTHWHAIPTIMACQANKDVYVEKPDAHNIIEGQTKLVVIPLAAPADLVVIGDVDTFADGSTVREPDTE